MTGIARASPMNFLVALAKATRLRISFEWSAPLLLALMLARALDAAPVADGNARAAAVALYVAAGFAALLLHEWAHAAAALLAGARPAHVVVHGLGGAVHVGGVPSHQQGAVAAAGPVMTLTVAAVAWLAARAASIAGRQDAASLATDFALLHLVLGAFNLLPLGELDGGRLASLGRKARVARACAWTMVLLLVSAGLAAHLASSASPAAAWFGGAVALGGVAGALVVGWHGVLNAVSGARNEWGELVA